MSKWNKTRFSTYTSDEKSVLGLLEELGTQVNHNTDNKTDLLGDHKGSWQGLSKPTLSEEGMRATVEKHITEISDIKNDISNLVDNVNNIAITINQENIDLLKNGGSFILSENLIFTETFTINKPISLNGNGYKILLGTRGLNHCLIIEDTKDVFINNIAFDSQLIARSVIRINRCENVNINNCLFTGYSKEFGYYKIDGAITLSMCKNAIISQCKFYKWGDQYGTSTEDLNRCINIMDNSEFIIISQNNFNSVNQAIVASDSLNIIINDNFFVTVKDNSIYIFNCYAHIEGNIFNDKFDESVVIGGGEYLITNNTFKDIPNKAIAITSPTKFIKIDGNNFINKINLGQFIVYRDVNDKVSNLIIENNTFSNVQQSNDNPLVHIGNTDYLNIINNKFFVYVTKTKRCLYIQDTTNIAGEIRNNVICNSNAQYDSQLMTLAINNSSVFTTVGNTLINGRANIPTHIKTDTYVTGNVQYQNGDQKKPVVYWCDSIPSWLSSPPNGTRVNKTTISSDRITGWVYDGSTWLKILGTA